jgi:hypothetical protein
MDIKTKNAQEWAFLVLVAGSGFGPLTYTLKSDIGKVIRKFLLKK